MNIMVTGATGFIGEHLVPVLSENHNVHILARPQSDVSQYTNQHICIYTGDVESLVNYMSANRIDGIVHLASLYLASHTSDRVSDLVTSNVRFPAEILQAAVDAGVKWFLNTGTIWQNYNMPDGSDSYNPVNLYAATKQAFIDVARYFVSVSKISFVTLKLCDTYGPRDHRRKFMSLLADQIGARQPLDVSPGEQKIDILYIDDVVTGFIRLIEMLQHGEVTSMAEYVLTSGQHITLRELAAVFGRCVNKPLNLNWGGRSYREREVMVPYRGNTLPGWCPRVSLEEGISLFVQS